MEWNQDQNQEWAVKLLSYFNAIFRSEKRAEMMAAQRNNADTFSQATSLNNRINQEEVLLYTRAFEPLVRYLLS